MRAFVWLLAPVLGLAMQVSAQDARPSEDWKKMYDDAAAQLRLAQDRKSQLSGDNAQLTTRVAELEKQVQTLQSDLAALRHDAETFGEQTSMLRVFYSGWQVFMTQNSDISDRWCLFFGSDRPCLQDDMNPLCNPQWPLGRPQ